MHVDIPLRGSAPLLIPHYPLVRCTYPIAPLRADPSCYHPHTPRRRRRRRRRQAAVCCLQPKAGFAGTPPPAPTLALAPATRPGREQGSDGSERAGPRSTWQFLRIWSAPVGLCRPLSAGLTKDSAAPGMGPVTRPGSGPAGRARESVRHRMVRRSVVSAESNVLAIRVTCAGCPSHMCWLSESNVLLSSRICRQVRHEMTEFHSRKWS